MGFHPEERALLLEVLKDCRLIDLFRHMNPEEKMFTFWDYRAPNGFKRDLGWRIDHMLVNAPVAAACGKCWAEKQMRGQERPSDHTPLAALVTL
jgi:exodeoxyribonuclease-3